MATAYFTSLITVMSGLESTYKGDNNIRINDVAGFADRYTIVYSREPFSRYESIGKFIGYTSEGSPVFQEGSVFYIATNDRDAEPKPVFGSPNYGLVSYYDGPYVACFLTGARIATPRGEVAVETLAPGDRVTTADGRDVAVAWVGRQSVAALFGAGDDRAPICIDAGALSGLLGGANLPVRDLKLTADHALLLDGVLVQAGALVNGASIRRMTPAETGARYAVWHIETEGHEIVLAEGCPAETFVDNVTRARFDNYAEYLALFGEEAARMTELELPRVKSARQLPASLRAPFPARQAA